MVVIYGDKHSDAKLAMIVRLFYPEVQICFCSDDEGRATDTTAGMCVVRYQINRADGAWYVTVTAVTQDGLRTVDDSSQAVDREILLLHKNPAHVLVQRALYRLLVDLTGFNPSPWGILQGIRPAKLAQQLMDSGLTADAISAGMSSHFIMSFDKAELLTRVALAQRPFLLSARQAASSVSVYIGIPFCPSRCSYCSFPAYSITEHADWLEPFMQVLTCEVNRTADLIAQQGRRVQAIYIGGGTPTSIPLPEFSRLLMLVRERLYGQHTTEFTVEAGRPDTLDAGKLLAMKDCGVTRISVNPQTMQDKTLKAIGRNHTVRDIIEMFHLVSDFGFPVVNMDLIVGLPGETLYDMENTLQQIQGLGPNNVTIHTLALKRASRLKTTGGRQWLGSNLLIENMLALCRFYTQQMSLLPYYLYRQRDMAANQENVGYAKPGTECFYNIQTISERQTVIGCGAAASTKVVDPRTWRLRRVFNPKDPLTYITGMETYWQRKAELLRGFEGS